MSILTKKNKEEIQKRLDVLEYSVNKLHVMTLPGCELRNTLEEIELLKDVKESLFIIRNRI